MKVNKKNFATLMLSTFILGALQLPANAQETSIFSDVSSDFKYADAIEYLKENKIVQGYPDGSYQPDQKINRAEFVKILIASKYSNLSGQNCFPDVKSDWYAPYVCKAKELGIVAGFPDGNFKPEQPITFAEASKIVANFFELEGGTAGEQWFQTPVTKLETQNAIPLSVEFFNEDITRDEMAEMVYRLKADVRNKATRTYREIEGNKPFNVKTCSELEERYLDLQNQYYGDVIYYKDAMREESTAEPVSAPANSADMAGSGADSYSTTNVQVQGVDEGDIVKNDGRYIYVIKGNTIRIIDAYPASNLKELVKFEFTSKDQYFYPTDLYLDGNMLVVLGSSNVYYAYDVQPLETTTTVESKIAPVPYNNSRVKAFVLDVSDHTKPKVVRSAEFDGYLNTSRKVDDTLYLVVNYSQYYPYPYYGIYAPQSQDFGLYVPKMKDSTVGSDEQIAPCDQIKIIPHTQNFNYLITAAIPLKDLAKKVARSVVIGNTENVYASRENLYIASTDWSGPYWLEYFEPRTKLFRFALTPSSIEFQASGEVPGTVLNQFSMDEQNDVLRIATTEQNRDFEQSNGVYTLNQNLETMGKITGLAPDERLYSARFFGNRAYLVTFQQVDPLFVIDLTNASSPKLLGELKIPGYSTYLHPYDQNHIIGFGQDTTEPSDLDSPVTWTQVKGLKIALFDVTNPASPKELHKEVIGDQGTWSDLLYNHKALLVDKEKNLFAFPVSVTALASDSNSCGTFTYSTCPSTCTKRCVPTSCTTENGVTVCTTDCDGADSCQAPYSYPKTVFVGAYVYELTVAGGFKLKAKITHLNDLEIAELLKTGWLSNYDKTIQRVLYIGENLYTVSQAMVQAHSLSSYAKLNSAEISGTNYDIYPTPYIEQPVAQ